MYCAKHDRLLAESLENLEAGSVIAVFHIVRLIGKVLVLALACFSLRVAVAAEVAIVFAVAAASVV
jgi:hypothetical protein